MFGIDVRAKFEERWRADRLKPLLKPLLACSSARCTRSPERHSLPSPSPDEFGTASDPRRPTAGKLKVLFTGSATTSKLNVSSAKRAVRAAERLRRQSSTTKALASGENVDEHEHVTASHLHKAVERADAITHQVLERVLKGAAVTTLRKPRLILRLLDLNLRSLAAKLRVPLGEMCQQKSRDGGWPLPGGWSIGVEMHDHEQAKPAEEDERRQEKEQAAAKEMVQVLLSLSSTEPDSALTLARPLANPVDGAGAVAARVP